MNYGITQSSSKADYALPAYPLALIDLDKQLEHNLVGLAT